MSLSEELKKPAKEKILYVLQEHRELSFQLLYSLWLDICNGFLSRETFKKLLEELEKEGKIQLSREKYQLNKQ